MTIPPPRPRPAPAARGGVTLLELVAVVTLIGVFAAVAVSRSDGHFGDAAAKRTADEFAALMHAARTRAVLTGETTGLHFDRSAGTGHVTRATLSGWDAADARTPLGEVVEVPSGVTVTSTVQHARWDWEGAAADSGTSVMFLGPHRSWRIWSPPVTGAIRLSEQ